MQKITELEEMILKRRLRVINFRNPKYYDKRLFDDLDYYPDVSDIDQLIRTLQKLKKGN
jgi:hypothetical protein